MLKRNPKISFGNYYVFPGGMIEKQDYIQPWRENLGEWFKNVGVHYPDFSKRVCALRELYEETNLMFSRRTRIGAELCSLENYSHKYKNNFVQFSKACGITPDIDKMYGISRIGTPIGMFPVNDTQFYLYFQEDRGTCLGQDKQEINLNQDESTEYKWLTPDDALHLYSHQRLALFPPQILLLTYLTFLTRSYDQLRTDIAKKLQASYLSYVSQKMLYFNFY